MKQEKSLSQLADEHEYQEIKALENRVLYHSPLYHLENGEIPRKEADSFGTWTHLRMMGEDPRLPKMPEKPTLLDFMKLRFNVGIQQHLLQSGNLALKNGCSEKNGAGLPAPRYLRLRTHPQRPWLLGRATHRALCRRGG